MKSDIDQWEWRDDRYSLIKWDQSKNLGVGFYVSLGDSYVFWIFGNDSKWMRKFYSQIYGNKWMTFSLDQKEQAKQFVEEFIENAKQFGAFI